MNYQMELDKIIECIKQQGVLPRLLLHACCAPCSSYVLEYFSKYFLITIYYYNPNITEQVEYQKRVEEEKRLIQTMPLENPVSFLEGEYVPEDFFEMAKGKESLPERGSRCYDCYYMRLLKTAQVAKQDGYDYFGTTLSVSPHKNSDWLNEIGQKLSEEMGVPYLFSDFKKKEGYKRSLVLAKEYGLYRQDYCGCIYSKEAKERKENGWK